MFGKYRDGPDGKCCDVCNTRHCQWDACMPATRRKVQFNICVQWSFHKKRISCALACSRFLVSPQSCPNHLGHPLLQFTLRPGRMNQAKVFLPWQDILDVVEALHDDKHVVDADAEAEEGEDGVHGGVRERHGRGQAERDEKSEQYAGMKIGQCKDFDNMRMAFIRMFGWRKKG